ncbi:hypothetical protein [Streptomyces sp. RKAG337]|uniref:hypothetical protein n=1 Tax=Streptomyces sp. RKAG337 TaxID=2893404 RepID=UPI0020345223|nr:hypothetical protein [Streptomyces sp. RKAG337]MCM2430150.1 hypothetical protein [Streptomyces sp. RKAG337]
MDEENAPEIGALVMDKAADRLGYVMDRLNSLVQLRPPNGGTEWEADPRDIVPATTGDRLQARVVEDRARKRGG